MTEQRLTCFANWTHDRFFRRTTLRRRETVDAMSIPMLDRDEETEEKESVFFTCALCGAPARWKVSDALPEAEPEIE